MDLAVLCVSDEMKHFLKTITALLVCVASSQLVSGSEKTEKEEIHILAFFPFGLDKKYISILQRTAELAVEAINQHEDVLSGYNLTLTTANLDCVVESQTAVDFVKTFFYSGKKFSGIVGPLCSRAADMVSSITNRESISILNFHIFYQSLTNYKRQRYSFVSVALPNGHIQLLSRLADTNDWTKVAVLYEASIRFYSSAYSLLLNNKVFWRRVAFSAPISAENLPLSSIIDSHIRIVFVLCTTKLKMQIMCLINRVYPKELKFPTRQFVFAEDLAHYSGDSVHVNFNNHNYRCYKKDVQEDANGYLFTRDKTLIVQFANIVQDGVWALALALNNSIPKLSLKLGLTLSQYSYGHREATDIIREEVIKLNFTTESGRQIAFNNQISNVNSNVELYQRINNTPVCIEYYPEEEKPSNTCTLEAAEFITDTFNQKRVLINPALAVFFILCTVVALGLIVSTHVLTIVYRTFSAIRASSYRLRQLTFLGCYTLAFCMVCVTLTRGVPLSSESIVPLCVTHVWCVSVGLTLILGSVAAKTWRLYHIFIQMKKPGKFLSDWGLITYVLALVGINVVICGVMTRVYEFTIQHSYTMTEETEFVLLQCTSGNSLLWYVLIFTCPTIALFTALTLAILTRSIRHESFKTKNVIILTYTLAITLFLGIPTFAILKKTINAEYAVVSLTYISILLLCFQFQFFPPVLLFLRKKFFHKIPGLKRYSTSVSSKSYTPGSFLR